MSEENETTELSKNLGETNNTPLCISIPAAAKLLGVSRNTGYMMARMHQLPIIKCGKRRQVVPMAGLRRMLENTG